MAVLSSELRSALERAIVAARVTAETASLQALDALGVAEDRAPGYLVEGDRRLRVALRAEARQLGGFERLVEECAYELWHRMLFARFLAENELLIHPEHGVAVSLADCEEIAHGRRLADPWRVASEFAAVMLPGIFRQKDPVLQVPLAPEGQRALEEILAQLPTEVFTSDDGLGWVYQYWQAKKKKEVNASGRKIGGADIAPVTQLFTEHYMVAFLLENTLGAWWAARYPESPLVKDWEYLRFDDEGKPAAGSFRGWPESVAEVTVMDPCCGSGHFLVTAFEMLRRMRMEAEGLTASQAGDAVLRDNLFGLELDARCTQIAAFALALQAWRTGGYRQLPVPNVACSGISAKGRLDDWKNLANGDQRLETSLERLHGLFADAADLGSLIDPRRETDGELLVAQFEEVAPILEEALDRESTGDPSAAVFGSAAVGAVRAAQLLARRYTVVTTNPPFLARRHQTESLLRFAERRNADARNDLATMMIARMTSLVVTGGAVCFVCPQSWTTLAGFKDLRRRLLAMLRLHAYARLGPRAFRSISGEVVKAALLVAELRQAGPTARFFGIDASTERNWADKAQALRVARIEYYQQNHITAPDDARIVLIRDRQGDVLGDHVDVLKGLNTGDDPQFRRCVWELPTVPSGWSFLQSGPSQNRPVDGCRDILNLEALLLRPPASFAMRGGRALGKRGAAVGHVGAIHSALYFGTYFDQSVAVMIPTSETPLEAVLHFVQSSEFELEVRTLDSSIKVTEGSLAKVPFDPAAWSESGLRSSSISTDDATQWLFTGDPIASKMPPHVAIPRLLGFRWPRQAGATFANFPAIVGDDIAQYADQDGIVCIPAIRGERPAAERLRDVLAAAFGTDWSPAREADLLAGLGVAGKSLNEWLRDGFFEQHCQLFHQRPFVWQIWDGRNDGFSALVNCHRLNRTALEKLIYTYLGDWIRQQQGGVDAGIAGSGPRLNAAQVLQRNLELILEGEAPYDIFVRWKPIDEQPLGWEPDLNDGVRLNIRPFVAAGALRKNPKVNWNKDRGKDPESGPWYHIFTGDRINDHHLTLAEKRVAREAAAADGSA